jgi:cytidylate kinase
MRKNLVIAIDGYSSCGKSTLAKQLAKELSFIYIDSGAMYRAVTLYFIRNGINPENYEEVSAALSKIEINFHSRDYQSHITLNGEEVSEEIRQMPVSEQVSRVAANRLVRHEMVKQQQRMGQFENVVMDGRDIGSVVFEDAQVKFFMTADPKVRAMRRYAEMSNKGNQVVTLEEVFDNLAHRDYDDTTREESPLIRAEDAIVLDNTDLTETEQMEIALRLIRRHMPL